MHPRKRLSIKSATVAGIAASVLLGLAGLTLNPAPAKAVVYCTYVGYPAHCVARAGVVLRPRPVARAAVRHNAGGNLNGGVNRVGVRRSCTCLRVTTLARQTARKVRDPFTFLSSAILLSSEIGSLAIGTKTNMARR